MRDVRVEQDRIIVSWIGEARARPDAAEVVLGVSTAGVSAEEALADNAEQVESLLGHLANAGIARREVTVAGPTIGSVTSAFLDPTAKPPSGFTVHTYVRVREEFKPEEAARVIERVAAVLDATARAEARLVGSGVDAMPLGLLSGGEVMFVLRDSGPARAQAIAAAVRATRPLAEAAAAAGGGALGPLTGLHVSPPTAEQFQQAARVRELPLGSNEVGSPLINDVVVRAAVTAVYLFER